MPITWTIPSPTRTDDLVAHAAKATPAYWSGPGRPREDMKAIAAALRFGADDPVNNWLRMAYTEYAEDVWLDAKGRDLRRPRAAGESDDSYKLRQRQVDDAVTPAALLAAANEILAAAGLGPATLIELPRDGLFFGTSTAQIRRYWSRGYRFNGGQGAVVVLVPAGTPPDVAAAVAAAVGLKKAGGILIHVEVLT
jgi:hypothetical protein